MPNGDPSGARNRPVVRNRRWAWSSRTTCCTVRFPIVGAPTSSARWCHRSTPAKSSALLAVRPLIKSVNRSWRGAAVVDDYLQAAQEAGFERVRLIHGRGKGVQRAAVQRLLSSHPTVAEFWDAPEAHLGATVVRLKPPS